MIRTLVLSLIALAGCRAQRPAPAVEEPTTVALPGGVADDDDDAPDGIPAELKAGIVKWKNAGVYVDGKPTGMLAFGELPVALRPVWIEDEVSVRIAPGQSGRATRLSRQRHYRVAEYLEAVGVNLARVKEVHLYGPKVCESLVVSGRELRAHRKDFLFRFGGEVTGKPIPVTPPNFGNGQSPDKIAAVMVYIDRKPPTLVPDEGFVLDGELQSGVPYFGEPVRGGVRVYFDDKLATIIKRRRLGDDPRFAEHAPDGHLRWKLLPFLAAQGVDASHVAEAWIVRDQRRQERLTPSQLRDLTFESSDGYRGQIVLGANLRANVIALHSKPVPPRLLPGVRPEEEP